MIKAMKKDRMSELTYLANFLEFKKSTYNGIQCLIRDNIIIAPSIGQILKIGGTENTVLYIFDNSTYDFRAMTSLIQKHLVPTKHIDPTKPNYVVGYSENFHDDITIGSIRNSVDIYVLAVDAGDAMEQSRTILEKNIKNHSDYVKTSINPIEFYTFKKDKHLS
jgi:hypothetical protein